MTEPLPAHVVEMLARKHVTADLGCGDDKRGDIGIDFTDSGPNADVFCNLGYEALPLPDGSLDKVFAWDFLEHLPKIAHAAAKGAWVIHRPHLLLFNEVYRVLKPGGLFETVTPVTEPEVSGRALHVSTWNFETFLCFAISGFPDASRRIFDAEARMMRWHGYTARFHLESYQAVDRVPGRVSHAKAIFKALKS